MVLFWLQILHQTGYRTGCFSVFCFPLLSPWVETWKERLYSSYLWHACKLKRSKRKIKVNWKSGRWCCNYQSSLFFLLSSCLNDLVVPLLNCLCLGDRVYRYSSYKTAKPRSKNTNASLCNKAEENSSEIRREILSRGFPSQREFWNRKVIVSHISLTTSVRMKTWSSLEVCRYWKACNF